MLSKRTLLFVLVLLAALIACNLPSRSASAVPTTIPTPTIAAPTSPSESPTQALEQGETQAPGDQPDAPPPTSAPPPAAVVPTVPGATSPPTVEATPTDPPVGGVVDHMIIYGRDPIYKGGVAIIGWAAPGVEYVNIAAYGVDDYPPGRWISDYDPAQLAGKILLKVYESLPPTGQLSIYIPPGFAHQHMMLAVLPPGHDMTTISSSALGVIYVHEPGPDSTLYDFSGELAIRDFMIDLPTIEPGGPVGMGWQVAGAARIEIARSSGEVVGANLDPVGYLNFPAPDDYTGQVDFVLTAVDSAGGQVTQTITVTVN